MLLQWTIVVGGKFHFFCQFCSTNQQKILLPENSYLCATNPNQAKILFLVRNLESFTLTHQGFPSLPDDVIGDVVNVSDVFVVNLCIRRSVVYDVVVIQWITGEESGEKTNDYQDF